MQSALDHRLSDPAQRQRLTDKVLDRAIELRNSLIASTYGQRREQAEKELEGEFDFRLSSNPEEVQTIFDTENQSAQMIRSAWRFINARLAKDFFGSEPWLSAQPEGPLDGSIAAKIQKHSTWKLRQSNWKPSIKQSLGVALALGEVGIKTTYRVDIDHSERLEMILCRPAASSPTEGATSPTDETISPSIDDPAAESETITEPAETNEEQTETPAVEGSESTEPAPDNSDIPGFEPVLTVDGDYIYDTDQSAMAVDPATGQPTITFTKDPSIVFEPGMEWKEHLIEEQVRTYSNVDARPIYWRDLAFPENAENLEEAADRDVVAHTYQASASELLARFDPDGTNVKVQELIRKASYPDNGDSAEATKPKEANQEAGVPFDPEIVSIKVVEAYTKRDVMGNGRQSRVFMVILEQCRELLWIDYVANISPRAQWPITLAPINRVPGRAYGRGLFQIYEMAADILDRCISAIVARNKKNSNPTTIFNGHLTKEGADGEDTDLEFNPSKTYSCKDETVKASDILTYVGMPDLDERTWELVQFFMQLIQVESGVTSASQGDVSSLPSNSTATGVNSMLESSSVLHFHLLEEFRESIEPALQYAIELIYFRQDADETYEYMEGEGADEIMALSDAMAIRKMPINVRLLFQRTKRMEMRQAALDAIPQVQAFFAQLAQDPNAAKRMRPLYVQALRSMEIDNVDDILPTEDEIDQMIAAQQAALAGAQPPPPQGELGQPTIVPGPGQPVEAAA